MKTSDVPGGEDSGATPPDSTPASDSAGGPASNAVMAAMVDRLLGAMTGGPAMNCRPHSSRQRIDLTQLAFLGDTSAVDVVSTLLGSAGRARVQAKIDPPPQRLLQRMERRGRRIDAEEPPVVEGEPLTDEERDAVRAWERQRRVLNKLRAIAEDARDHERDTGIASLAIGFPLLSLPPTTRIGAATSGLGRRVLAPIAFIPVHLNLSAAGGGAGRVELSCRGEGAGRVLANDTLLLWLAQQCGLDADAEVELFDDPDGEDTWRELRELVRHVASLVGVASAPELEGLAGLTAAPTAAEADGEARPVILPSAVLGLYPSSNQGLLRDARAMAGGESVQGPVRSFIDLGERLGKRSETSTTAPPVDSEPGERPLLVAPADPCQARAVDLARRSRGLVVHGPPGTGKSQTITNVIADHLARGERVLFVCDKRTALDVVYDRLNHLGLGDLCALVHDPQRDRVALYKSIREQLEALPDRNITGRAASKLARADTKLTELRSDLAARRRVLLEADPAADPPISLHALIGRWLATESTAADVPLDAESLAEVRPAVFEEAADEVAAAIRRAGAVAWRENPWRDAIGLTLDDLLTTGGGVAAVRQRTARLLAHAEAADATAHESIPPFDPRTPLAEQDAARARLLASLEPLGGVVPAWAEVLRRDPQALSEARAQWAKVEPHAAALAETGLPEAALGEQAGDLSPAEAGRRRESLRAFEKAAARSAASVTRAAREVGPEGATCAIAWLGRPADERERAVRQLRNLADLAAQVAKASPDVSLLRRLRQAAFGGGELVQRRLAVATYASAARGFFGFLAFGKKKAASPTLAALGLPTDAVSAERAVQVLDAAQARHDLADALVELRGPEPTVAEADRLDDTILLRVYRTHKVALEALNEPGEAATQISPEVASALLAHLPEAAAARPAVEALGLTFDLRSVRRAATFYRAGVAIAGLREVRAALLPGAAPIDEDQAAGEHRDVTILLAAAAELGNDAILRDALVKAVADNDLPTLRDGLGRSPARSQAITVFESAADDNTFNAGWRIGIGEKLRRGALVIATIQALSDRADTVEDVIRVKHALSTLPPAIAAGLPPLLEVEAHADAAVALLRRHVDAGEISRRLAEAGDAVRNADGRDIDELVDRYRSLWAERAELVRDTILEQWIGRQRERLLSATGTRLAGLGADLRRRLAIRGRKVMRLRQLVSAGAGTEGGDPLFDLRPIWMASPETVAQVFPREPLFDVIVFDEASQVRLEEALPVMTRAGRIVIAGDPKQLPPTRFFESTLATSQEQEAETDQELFEAQQADAEDLLTAALGLDIDEAFLDVHYRSRNADLIGFSNEHFYGGRLQPIPGHPANVTPYPPLRLYRAQGIYADRQNEAEARQVVGIVRDLLKWAEPPSIGVACFNLAQRDLILEELDATAAEDPEFARRLATARERVGSGGFEGLFVKNLENVQGDERDHIVISTTYGPDDKGRFRRNFGPISQAGGGRRLNVLVTRARHEVHLVTCIPEGEYATLPPVPAGQQPTGRWLLYAYLHYAAALSSAYEQPEAETTPAGPAELITGRTAAPSRLVEAVAARAAASGTPAVAYWGGDGLGLDAVLGRFEPAAEPASGTGNRSRLHRSPLGVVCDFTRFAATDEPIEWEAFRRTVHLSQGWTLRRVWSPQAFREPTVIVRP